MPNDDEYTRQITWILRQNQLTPVQLTCQYKAYKDRRAEFEAGFGTVEDMTVLVTPGVVGMLNLEDKMLADLTDEQQTQQPPALVETAMWPLWVAWAAEGLFWVCFILAFFTALRMVLTVITNG